MGTPNGPGSLKLRFLNPETGAAVARQQQLTLLTISSAVAISLDAPILSGVVSEDG